MENVKHYGNPTRPSDGNSQEHLMGQDDGMRSLLEAAIGLTSLGAPTTPSPSSSEKITSSVSPVKGADAAAGPSPVLRNDEPARKKPKMTTMTIVKTEPTFLPSTSTPSILSRPTSLPFSHFHDQVPMFLRGNDLRIGSIPTSVLEHLSRNTELTHPLRSATAIQPPTSCTESESFHQYLNPAPASPSPSSMPLPASDDTQSFPETLYEILSCPSNHHILSWLPHGRGFEIHNKELFVSHILESYFDGAKYTSFTRRLKRWKFERVPRGPEMGAYYNNYFVRDSPDLIKCMIHGMDCEKQPREIKRNGQLSNVEEDMGKGNKKEPEAAQSMTTALDDSLSDSNIDAAVVAAAMEVHRHLKQQKLSKNHEIEPQEKNTQQQQQENHDQENRNSRDGSSSSNHPTPYNPNDYDLLEMAASQPVKNNQCDQQQKSPKQERKSQRKRKQQQGSSSPEPTPYNPEDSINVMLRQDCESISRLPRVKKPKARKAKGCSNGSTPKTSLYERHVVSPSSEVEGKQCMNDNEMHNLPYLPNISSNNVNDAFTLQNIPSSLSLSHEQMMSRILSGSKTHKEIMMMAARDLQSRGQMSDALQQHNQVSPQFQSMQMPLSLSMMQPLSLSRSRYLSSSHAMMKLRGRMEQDLVMAKVTA
mmetsp:Transcript_11364/g.24238  ORF Transcript_11364/g.24238 Transcript_11364/m.24238 type:complete len:647 (-) Transcript_11364:160-2100(-)|eukprot:CAMPEP_0183741936 /NCGR_PEP_ID=MMETSP0737-20130205/63538_1 /TAXON_ID=385413 /ORGANISM="Thalassiosira miniscula, Strain CCMP1093" /LENGTH=646 /DNA_ID=CAMNT_0025977437 /DNA_START=210 /DNA_END=2150 /DNA_ORIENTATION=-